VAKAQHACNTKRKHLPRNISPDGRIHAGFKLIGTETGRMPHFWTAMITRRTFRPPFTHILDVIKKGFILSVGQRNKHFEGDIFTSLELDNRVQQRSAPATSASQAGWMGAWYAAPLRNSCIGRALHDLTYGCELKFGVHVDTLAVYGF
jgi:hypothetical protein